MRFVGHADPEKVNLAIFFPLNVKLATDVLEIP